VAGLAGATAWIAAGLEQVVSYADLPSAPSREAYLAVVHDARFLNVPARVSEAMVMAITTAIVALAVRRARDVVRAHAVVEERRSRVQQLLGRYVPAQVAGQLVDEGRLAPLQREASILFADIEGFTRLSERLTAPQVIGLLNRFFDAAASLVEDRGGIVVNYVGDAVIAAFNAPLPLADHAARAVDAAQALQALVAQRDFEGHRLRLRIGVATGPLAAGTVGGATRQAYTVYGDTVNVAQRLERLNKELGTSILVCGTTFMAIRPAGVDSVAMGSLQLRGREASVDVFAVGPTGGTPDRG
jgi:adenylate cyclase